MATLSQYVVVDDKCELIDGPYDDYDDALDSFERLLETDDCALMEWIYEYADSDLLETSTGAPIWPDPELEKEKKCLNAPHSG